MGAITSSASLLNSPIRRYSMSRCHKLRQWKLSNHWCMLLYTYYWIGILCELDSQYVDLCFNRFPRNRTELPLLFTGYKIDVPIMFLISLLGFLIFTAVGSSLPEQPGRIGFSDPLPEYRAKFRYWYVLQVPLDRLYAKWLGYLTRVSRLSWSAKISTM